MTNSYTKMSHIFKFFFLLLFVEIGYAQYTPIINSKRPGFSDSPYSVGTKVYQVEGGLFYKKVGNYQTYINDVNGIPVYYVHSSTGFGSDLMLRTGLFMEKLEFNAELAFVNEDRDYTAPSVYSESELGLSKLTIGAKYLVYMPEYADKSKEIRSWKARHAFDTKRLIPAVGVYAGLNTNLLMDMYKNPEGISPRFAIFTQNDLSNRWIVLMNFIIDKAFTDEMENSFILTSTYSFTERISAFGEGQVFFRTQEYVPNDFQFGAGGAYLVNNNLQVDFSARMIYDEREDSSYLFGMGASWRLDRHKDKIIGNTEDEDVMNPDEKRGFFAGLFAGGWFASKSNNKKVDDVKVSKAKSRAGLQAPVNKKAQKAREKQNKQLIKDTEKKEKAERKNQEKENG